MPAREGVATGRTPASRGTGATGTGKTITLQTLAENFSKQGVPVFMADVKGDLTGISQRGTLSAKIASILKERGLPEPGPVLCCS